MNMSELLRDENGVAHIVGLSGGKDSVCMALMLREKEPRPYNYVYTPTGDELPEMVQHMDFIENMLGQKLIVLTNGTLKSITQENNMLPNCHARFCTRILKLRPFGKLIEKAQPAVCYVGLRDDEDDREGTRPGGDSASIDAKVKQDFPFRRWGVDLDGVIGYLADKGITIPQRTDCARCPYQTLGEWYNLWLNHIEIYLDAENDELVHGHTYRSPTGNHGPWPHDLKSLRLEFEKGRIPKRSLDMMAKRKNMCRACSL
jgi:3'-phosphoadenosine 5'-phosphosulfate sulfotransferase (PAPS reductase)/FAD synthetase